MVRPFSNGRLPQHETRVGIASSISTLSHNARNDVWSSDSGTVPSNSFAHVSQVRPTAPVFSQYPNHHHNTQPRPPRPFQQYNHFSPAMPAASNVTYNVTYNVLENGGRKQSEVDTDVVVADVSMNESTSSKMSSGGPSKPTVGAWIDVPEAEDYDSRDSGESGLKNEYQRGGKLLMYHSRTRGSNQFVVFKCDCGFRARLLRKSDTCWRPQLRAGHPIHNHEGDELDIPSYIREAVMAMLREDDDTRITEPMAIFRHLGRRFPCEKFLMHSHGVKTKIVITNMVNNYRSRRNGNPITSVFEFAEWKGTKRLSLPEGYMARAEYGSAEELAVGLGVTDPDELFVLEPTQQIKDLIMSLPLDKKAETMHDSACITCAADLYNALDMMKTLPPEEWVCYADGTHGLTFNNRVLCVFHTLNVAYRKDQRQLTQSGRPMITGWWGGERRVGVQLTLYVLIHHVKQIFGLDIAFRISVSDFAPAFLNGFRAVFPGIRTLVCWTHAKKGLTMGENIKLLVNEKESLPKIKSDLKRLHRCKTPAMFNAIAPLVLADWREELGESRYCETVEEQYFASERNCWYVSASGVLHITPSSNISEAHHGMMKGSKKRKALLDVGASMHRAVNVELPKLFQVHYREKHGVEIRFPGGFNEMPKYYFHLLKLVDISVDTRSSDTDSSTWYVNAPHRIGTPITDDDIMANDKACAGDMEYFEDDKERAFKGGLGLCKVTKRSDGAYIGDCHHCRKKLGCVGVWLIRFEENDISDNLEDVLKSLGERKAGGNYHKKHFGGCRLPPNLVVALPENETVRSYYERQSMDTLKAVCKLLLMPHSGRNKTDLVDQIVQFHELAARKHNRDVAKGKRSGGVRTGSRRKRRATAGGGDKPSPVVVEEEEPTKSSRGRAIKRKVPVEANDY